MPLYEYEILEGPLAGQSLEIEHKMTDPAYETLTVEGTNVRVKRVIAGSSNFILKGSNWGRDGYTTGTQSYNPKDRDSRGPK